MLKTNYKTKNPLFLLDRSIARFHSHGELINNNHLINIFTICKNYPKTEFTLWTKNKSIVYDVILNNGYKKPKNLKLIYSNIKVNKPLTIVPNFFDGVFNVVTDDFENENIDINCFSKCAECKICYSDELKNVEIITERIKKNGKKLTTNETICKACYSFQYLKIRKTMLPPLEHNSIILSDSILDIDTLKKYVHVSKGSAKMIGIDSINTNTLSNKFCNKMHSIN
jgi:predicted Zn-ribbon and HTH transcriptional regulator